MFPHDLEDPKITMLGLDEDGAPTVEIIPAWVGEHIVTCLECSDELLRMVQRHHPELNLEAVDHVVIEVPDAYDD